MRMKVTVTGTADLQRKLSRMSDNVKGRNLAAATLAGAMVIEQRAKELTPVRTGNLRRSIHSQLADSRPESASAKVGTNVEYSPYVEYGTRRMSARPYLRPALDEKRAEARRVIKEAFAKLTREAVR